MQITGTVALITGGARIGVSVARALAERGAGVVLTYRRSRAACEETARTIVAAGGAATCLQLDVRDPDAVARVVDEAAAWRGRLDILVNLASVYRQRPWDALDVDAWDEDVNTDARSGFLLTRAAASWLRRGEHGGRVILFADYDAASGRPRARGFVPYYAAKSAVIGLTEALARELAPEILVNAVAPGPILPPPDMSEALRREVERATPLARWGGAAEIAKAVVFLIESDFITGEVLRVDGGRHLQ